MKHLLSVVLIAAGTIVLTGCGEEKTIAVTTSKEAPPLPADVAAVSAAVSTSTVTTTTTVINDNPVVENLAITGEFVSPVRSEVAAKIIGRVSRMYVDEGTRVTRGQPLLQLETDYLRLNLQAAEAQTAQARAAMNEAERDLGRKKELIGKGSIPQATYDRSQTMYEQARAAVAGASAQASLLRQQIADSTVRSPINGVIETKRTDVGQKLGDGGVVFVVAQTSPIRLRFSVPERYLGKVRPGQTVTAQVDPYPGESFNGTIKTVGGVIDPRTRTMFAEAEFANRDARLRPGLFARVETKFD